MLLHIPLYLFVQLVFCWPVSGSTRCDCCTLGLNVRHKETPLRSKWTECSVTWENHPIHSFIFWKCRATVYWEQSVPWNHTWKEQRYCTRCLRRPSAEKRLVSSRWCLVWCFQLLLPEWLFIVCTCQLVQATAVAGDTAHMVTLYRLNLLQDEWEWKHVRQMLQLFWHSASGNSVICGVVGGECVNRVKNGFSVFSNCALSFPLATWGMKAVWFLSCCVFVQYLQQTHNGFTFPLWLTILCLISFWSE